MKTKFLLLVSAVLAFLPFSSIGQQLPDTMGLTVDMLQVPNSPAFALMDLAPSMIDEPKVPADFMVFLRNTTDSFTTLPRNFGFEFAPAWIFGRDNIDFTKFKSNNLGRNMWQSLTLSAGINHANDPELPEGNGRNTQLGFGLKISLLRGEMEDKYNSIDSLYKTMAEVNDSMYHNIEAWFVEDPKYKMWDDSANLLLKQKPIDKDKLKEALKQRDNQVDALMADTARFRQQVLSKFQPQFSALKAQTMGLKLNRRGFKLDLAGGFATDFYDQSAYNSQITKAGGWLTGGWVFKPSESQLNSSLFGVLRLIGNPKQLYRPADGDSMLLTNDNLFFDYGGRGILHNGKRFRLSAELLGRMPINNDALKSSVRYAVSLDYQLTPIILLSFNFGKNFDGTVNKGGNLITALQLFSSFGKRSYTNGKMR